MKKEDLINRNKIFVLDVVNFVGSLPNVYSSQVFGKQLIRCASSVGANYRAACRAKSEADFINKLKIVEEEIDESIYFLDLLLETSIENKSLIMRLLSEANQLLAIYIASIKTMKNKKLKK